jgi:prepilin peptidase CpaA
MLDTMALVIFPGLMVFAAFSDLFTMTIPNRVSLALTLGYFALAAYLPIPWQVLALHASCGVATLVLTFVMFQFKWIGGGDAKLASATALWLGWEHLLDYGVIASIAGGVLTVLIVAMRWYDLPGKLLSIGFIARLADKGAGIPYGIALALAGLLVYPNSGVFARLGGL